MIISVKLVIILAAIFLIGILLGYLIRKIFAEIKVKTAESLAKRIVLEAEKEAENKKKESLLEAKESLYKLKAEFEKGTHEKRNEVHLLEKRILQREENLEKRIELIDRKDKDIGRREKDIANSEAKIKGIEQKYNSLIEEELKRLERVSGMTAEQAKEEIKVKLLNDARFEAANLMKKIEDEAKATAADKAKMIISLAIQRCAADHVAETTVSVVDLPDDDMKGRIIGREGRNIRSLEIATGVDLIVDDTPGAVTISSYDPIKREVAKITLERLISDGRIHPGRIEDVVEKVKKEVAISIKEEGEKAAFEVGIDGLHPEVIKLLGRLKYRTSYSQNVLQHSKEVAFLCGMMAAELGTNVKMAKRAGLLHDIGKAVDHQTEGTHTQIGVDLARRYNESKIVINAIASHHEDVEAESIIAVLVAASDALSASRPGARREMLESYVKRLEQLEKVCDSFKGVDKAYAIHAGREIRVIVEPDKLNDSEVMFLAKDIAKKIEADMAYPGEIKVTVLREVRAIEYAR
ncbi:MAG: ribonuclease Y [Nitrospinae bacterium RIFCSPLOWO2_02_39_17]|nr:MAG: ribonuclease Y [Nitrospinae bacterium RIFCSPLOWO2_02_39_17]